MQFYVVSGNGPALLGIQGMWKVAAAWAKTTKQQTKVESRKWTNKTIQDEKISKLIHTLITKLIQK